MHIIKARDNSEIKSRLKNEHVATVQLSEPDRLKTNNL